MKHCWETWATLAKLKQRYLFFFLIKRGETELQEYSCEDQFLEPEKQQSPEILG